MSFLYWGFLSWVQRKSQLPESADLTSFVAAQDTAGCLGCITYWPDFHPSASQVLCRDALDPFTPQLVLILGVVPAQRQNLAFGHVKIHELYMGPLLNPVKVLHQSSNFKKPQEKFLILTILSKNMWLNNNNNNFQTFLIVLWNYLHDVFIFSLSRRPRNYFLFLFA